MISGSPLLDNCSLELSPPLAVPQSGPSFLSAAGDKSLSSDHDQALGRGRIFRATFNRQGHGKTKQKHFPASHKGFIIRNLHRLGIEPKPVIFEGSEIAFPVSSW